MAADRMLRCSFCGQTPNQFEKIVVGPSAYSICTECIDICNEIAAEESQDNAGVIYRPQCSFCKADEKEAERLIPGPDVCICLECLNICAEIRGRINR
jgi:ATP-dependent protease Clp ATPase subunit